jgi:hypothetical protein
MTGKILMSVEVLVHDLPRFVQPVIGGKVGECFVHEFVVLRLKKPGDVIDDARRKDAIAFVEFSFLKEDPARFDAARRKHGQFF